MPTERDEVHGYLVTLLNQDPGLPRTNPTSSYWQHIPHAFATTRSQVLSATVDVAVIGSGITGTSVTKTILEQNSTLRVTVFEARTLCSGATGRNGGQLAINAAETYVELKKSLGAEMAGKIIRFNLKTLDRLREVAREIGVAEYAELTDVVKLRSFTDSGVWEHVKDGVKALQADHPSLAAMYRIIEPADCVKEYGLSGVVGAVTHPAGSVWPYRLITKIFENLVGRFPSRLAIETHTPITGVDYDLVSNADFPYILQTPRGVVRAAQIAYCVNGYTSHLLPRLRGTIYPLKGTMTVQDLASKRPNDGSKSSWAIHYTPFRDAQDGTVADGLMYGMQNPVTGAFFFGGEKTTMADLLSANDNELSSTSVRFLRESLLSIFGENPAKIQDHKLISSWSGVMGFTSDGMPLVGRLPGSLTQRPGSGEWLCAGYNGYGMPAAWLAGESLGRMILGAPLHPHLPEAYLLSEQRMKGRLSLKESVKRFASL